MKMLDPRSVVRESEQQLVIQSTTLPESLMTRAKRMFVTGQTLSPTQRRIFIERAKKLANPRLQAYEADKKRMSNIAKRHGINPEDIGFRDFSNLYSDDTKTMFKWDPNAKRDDGGKGAYIRSDSAENSAMKDVEKLPEPQQRKIFKDIILEMWGR
jgi:hypothetical protein